MTTSPASMKTLSRWAELTLLVAVIVAAGSTGGCSKQKQKKAIDSQPADTGAPTPIAPATRPAEPAPSAPGAATRPTATRPATTLPASTYDSRPPYPVRLHVRSPRDRQPGWLTILELADPEQPASATGEFPRQNWIHIDTTNVQRIRIHVGHLPTRRDKSINVRIDDMPTEFRGKKNREFITMGRTPAGVWQSIKPETGK